MLLAKPGMHQAKLCASVTARLNTLWVLLVSFHHNSYAVMPFYGSLQLNMRLAIKILVYCHLSRWQFVRECCWWPWDQIPAVYNSKTEHLSSRQDILTTTLHHLIQLNYKHYSALVVGNKARNEPGSSFLFWCKDTLVVLPLCWLGNAWHF